MSSVHLGVLLLLISLLSPAWSDGATGFPGGDYVVEITKDNFDSLVRNRPKEGLTSFYLVEFYSPYCGPARLLSWGPLIPQTQ